MYDAFYGFREKPFSLLPDPEYLYLSPQHQKALGLLELSLHNQAGFCVISGDIGAGKTTLVRKLLEQVGDEFAVGLVTNTHHNFGELMSWVLMAFDLQGAEVDAVEQHETFIDFVIDQYARGKRTVLIIDEAQNMSVDALEELRMLSNVNADKDQVLQTILVGQAGLRETLKRPELAQFAQRILLEYHLGPLSEEETGHYIRHRVQVAGARPDLFSAGAASAVYRFSGGIPRVINLICDTALVYGYAEESPQITEALINAVARERENASAPPALRLMASAPAVEEVEPAPLTAVETVGGDEVTLELLPAGGVPDSRPLADFDAAAPDIAEQAKEPAARSPEPLTAVPEPALEIPAEPEAATVPAAADVPPAPVAAPRDEVPGVAAGQPSTVERSAPPPQVAPEPQDDAAWLRELVGKADQADAPPPTTARRRKSRRKSQPAPVTQQTITVPERGKPLSAGLGRWGKVAGLAGLLALAAGIGAWWQSGHEAGTVETAARDLPASTVRSPYPATIEAAPERAVPVTTGSEPAEADRSGTIAKPAPAEPTEPEPVASDAPPAESGAVVVEGGEQPEAAVKVDPVEPQLAGDSAADREEPAADADPVSPDAVAGTAAVTANKPAAEAEPEVARKTVSKAQSAPATKPAAKAEPAPAKKTVVRTEAAPVTKPVARTRPAPAKKTAVKTQPAPAKPVAPEAVAKAQPAPVEPPVAKSEPVTGQASTATAAVQRTSPDRSGELARAPGTGERFRPGVARRDSVPADQATPAGAGKVEAFVADPCKGPAAHYLSTCR